MMFFKRKRYRINFDVARYSIEERESDGWYKK